MVARYRSPATFEFVEEECYDLSTGGMFVKSTMPAPAGTLLKLECDAGKQGKIKGVARVVWLRRVESEHGPSGMGVKFVKLEGQSRAVIDAIVRRMGDAGEIAPSMSMPPEARVAEPMAVAAGSGAVGPISVRPGAPLETPRPRSERPPAMNVVGVASLPPAPALPKLEPAPSESDADRVSDVRALLNAPVANNGAELARTETLPGTGSALGLPVDLPASDEAPEQPQPEPLRSTPPRAGWWKPWAWTGGAAMLFLAIVSSDWFLGDQDDAQDDALPPMAAPEDTVKLGLAKAEGEAEEPHAPLVAAEPVAAAPAVAASPQPTAAASAPVEPPSAPAPAAVVAEPIAVAHSAPEPPAAPPKPAVPVAPPAASPAAAPPAAAAKSREYVIEVNTNPPGATIMIGEQSFVSPARATFASFDKRLRVAAEKEGYQPTAIWLERGQFTLTDGVMLRRMYLGLKALDAAAPGNKPAVAASTPAATGPAAAAAGTPAAAPAKPATAKTSPLETATACLAQGDNGCVIAALEGKAKTPREHEMLIETLRAVGRSREAQKHMAAYIEKFPDERRSASYRRTLELQAEKPAPAAPAAGAGEAPADNPY
jgi:hypothetical protein